MTYTKFDPIQFETELELLEIMRDKSKDYHHKETEELKKQLTKGRKQNISYICVTSHTLK